MPRPGGSGGRAGGGFGGGFGGGGNFGGGFRPPHRPRGHYGMGFGFWPWGWGFRPRFYGGGCFGGIFGLVLVIVMIVGIIAYTLSNSFSVITSGGRIIYNEEALQDYAYGEYKKLYGENEDAILVTLLIEDEEYWDYVYTSMIGLHIKDEVAESFSPNGAFGTYMTNNIDKFYKYSLAPDVSDAVEDVTETLTALSLDSYYNENCNCEPSTVTSKTLDRTEMGLNVAIIDAELSEFTEATGIPIILIIEDADDEAVFGRKLNGSDIFILVVAGLLIILLVVIIVSTVRKRRKESNPENNPYNTDPFGNQNE